MNIENEKKLETYKLDHNTIKSLTTIRLKQHLDKVKKIKNEHSVYEPFIIYNSDNEMQSVPKESYLAIKRYVYFITQELKYRVDYSEVINQVTEKRKQSIERRKTKGCQHLKSQKK